jgi:hypothetical protein
MKSRPIKMEIPELYLGSGAQRDDDPMSEDIGFCHGRDLHREKAREEEVTCRKSLDNLKRCSKISGLEAGP